MSMMADKMAARKSAQSKRAFNNVPSTPGQPNDSPLRKQKKGGGNDPNDDEIDAFHEQEQRIATLINNILDVKLEAFATRIESMVSLKIKALEDRFVTLQNELAELKEDYNESLNHVEQDLRIQIDDTWEYAVRNEQYSRKNNIRIYGLEENPDENLQEKIIGLAKEELGVEIKDKEIEIAHRIGQTRRSQSKPRAVIIKFLSNKSKMQLLSKRKLLKGKSIAVMEDMASDLAKRLKKFKDKSSVEKAWFVNGKIRFIQRGDTGIQELRGWNHLSNIA